MCEKNGPQLGEADDLLHRQVPHEWTEAGEPSSQAFWPWRTIVACCLSVDRNSRTTAEAAFNLFTAAKPSGFGMSSCGVWALSCDEIKGESLTAWEDPAVATNDTPANPAHAVIDFTAHDAKTQKKIARKLKALAIRRGCLHPVPVQPAPARTTT